MKHIFVLLAFLVSDSSLAQMPTAFGFFKPATATPPTFIQEAEISWTGTTTPVTTASFNVLAGDVLVAYAGSEHDNGQTLGISGGSLTWTLQQSINPGVNGWAEAYIWTAVVDADKAMTVSFTYTSTPFVHGGNVLTFRNTGGVGASAKANVDSAGGPTVNITTTKANSAIVVFSGDYKAQTGARTWRTNAGAVTEQTYVNVSGIYTVYGGFHANAGAIGTYAVGLSAPVGQKFSVVAVEIKGP